MEMTFDAILLLVSGAAGLYCFILSRRLRALQDMKTGLGASIISMTTAISQLKAASEESKFQTSAVSTQLKILLKDAEKKISHIQKLNQTLEQTASETKDEVNKVQNELSTSMHHLLLQSHEQIEELTSLMKQLRVLSEKTLAPYSELPPALPIKPPSTKTNSLKVEAS